MNDWFILINLLRLCQDSPLAVHKVKELMDAGYSMSFALLVGISLHGISGHSLIYKGLWQRIEAIPEKVREYDFVKRWEGVPHGFTISQDREKTILVREVFMKGITFPTPQKPYTINWSTIGGGEPKSNFGAYNDVEGHLLEAYKKCD